MGSEYKLALLEGDGQVGDHRVDLGDELGQVLGHRRLGHQSFEGFLIQGVGVI